jgi:hypothetical protein
MPRCLGGIAAVNASRRWIYGTLTEASEQQPCSVTTGYCGVNSTLPLWSLEPTACNQPYITEGNASILSTVLTTFVSTCPSHTTGVFGQAFCCRHLHVRDQQQTHNGFLSRRQEHERSAQGPRKPSSGHAHCCKGSYRLEACHYQQGEEHIPSCEVLRLPG